MYKTIARIFSLFLLFSFVLVLAVPVHAQDTMSDGDIVFATGQIFGLLVVGLLGGGVGYIIRAIKEARDERFMTLLEHQYNASNGALKQAVLTLESVSRYLAVSIPMTPDMRRSFLEVANFVDEVTDGVPIASKDPVPDDPVVRENTNIGNG